MVSWLVAPLLSLPTFQDRSAELGLALGNEAACWADINNDGFSDLITSGVVWKNEAGKRFSKLAEVAPNVVGADYDNDGFNDLFSWSARTWYHNDKGLEFTAHALAELPATVSRGACWGDFSGDGWVDLFLGGFEGGNPSVTQPSFLLLNEKGKRFQIAQTDTEYRARGVTACDFDRDGDLDLYVSNYRLMPNRLWRNDGKGTLTDAARELNAIATSEGFQGGHSIGAAWGDFDCDGFMDLFAGNFAHIDSRGDQPKSRFLRNLGKASGFKFEDKGTCGVHYQESYASPTVGDFDNDGRLDLFFTTVYFPASFGKPNYPVLFRNLGDFKFAEISEAAGIGKLPPTYQAASCDFDLDGDLDLVTAGKLWVNTSAKGNWLGVRLKGDGKRENLSAIGAQARIKLGSRVLVRQVEAGTGEGNQNDLALHFGLGDHADRVNLEISWPGGRRQTLRSVKARSMVTVTYR